MGWIGIDLDGTLAVYRGWQGEEHIGRPIPAMKDRVIKMLQQGKDVRIFSARASTPEAKKVISAWLKENGFGELPITNVKDSNLEKLYDDKAVAVETNTGKILGGE